MQAGNGDVIYISVTGFGQDGPNRDLPATDSILQAYSDLMAVNRNADGMPQRVSVLVIDVVTGLYAHPAAATALYRRATRVLGLPELARDPRYATGAVRLVHEAELMPLLRERVKTWSLRSKRRASCAPRREPRA